MGDVGLGPADGGEEFRGIGLAQVQQVDGVVEHGLDIQAELAVALHPGECLKGHQQVIVEVVDLLVQHVEIGQEGKFPVQGAGIGLDIDVQGLAALGAPAEQHLPVVHVRALDHLAVDEHQELGVLAVIPFLDLGVDAEPHGLPVEALRDDDLAAEPVVGAGDAVEIRVLALEFPLELVGPGVVGIPAHALAVEPFPGRRGPVRLLRAEELAFLIFPVRQADALPEAEIPQLIADDLNSLIDKIHRHFLAVCFL